MKKRTILWLFLASIVIMSFKTLSEHNVVQLIGEDLITTYVNENELTDNLPMIMNDEDVALNEVNPEGTFTGKKIILCPGTGVRCNVTVTAGNDVYVIRSKKAKNKPHVLIVAE